MNFTRLHEFAINHKVDYSELVKLLSVEMEEASKAMTSAAIELTKMTRNADDFAKMLVEQDKRLKEMAGKVHDFNALPWYLRLWQSFKRI